MDLESQISPFVRRSFPKLGLQPGALILDAPCGFGRHSYWLASLGYDVHAIDIDRNRLETAERYRPPLSGQIGWRLGDLETPLQTDTAYDALITVHYFSESIVRRAHEALKIGGVFLFETFGGQGRNFLALPKAGEFQKMLGSDFELCALKERPVGPQKLTVSLTAIARKQR